MAKKFNASQFKSQIRRIQSQQNQALRKLDTAVRKYNSEMKKQVNAYNKFVREYNASVRHNRQIIEREARKLNSYSNGQMSSYRMSVSTMQQWYHSVNQVYGEGVEITPAQNHILNLIEEEQATSLITANAVENDSAPEVDTQNIELGNKLQIISIDLHNRWKGAIFALNPENPDASRHFCTSAREIFTEFIECKAPDKEVFAYNPSCERTKQGNATRREKIRYMMRNVDMDNSVIEFADANIQNILELFHVLSDGTHGASGRYEFNKLIQVKKRVEQGINFLCEISA